MNLYFPLKIDINSKQIIVLSLYYALIKRQKQKDIKIRKKQKALKIRKKQQKIQGKKQPNYNFSDWNESHNFQRKIQIGDGLKLKIKYVSLEPTMDMAEDFGMEHIYTDLTDSDWNETHNFQRKIQIGDLKIKYVSLEPTMEMDMDMDMDFGMEHIYTDLTDSDWNETHNFQRKIQIGDELKIKIKSVSLEPTMAMDVEMDDDFGMEHIYTDLTDSDWNERETHKFQKKYK